ncbi:MAG TPA: SDR family oxidoreductase [Burkholderiaceae bacterium]|nr:SDR family oxidoreductase [Burkholderiaceae bacterium]HNB43992.1 SDR family oxidoreductase [Burkholderiaceae bacterium]HNG80610.1 SDR family oxidoreductase [Burkholderiaceae bacterium]
MRADGPPASPPTAAQAPLAFITGASSGIGQALAAAYGRRGWRLALVARRLDAMRAWAQSEGLGTERCALYAADVQDVDAIVAAGQRCLIEQGLPQVVIANAGISVGIDSAERADLDVLREIFATNNVGLAATFHPFIRPMRVARQGRLVGIASVAAIRGLPGHGGYCASKAGVVAYCESLRGELRDDGIRVVTLLPGFVDTPLTRGNPYPMPFLMPATAFAEQAIEAIERGDRQRVIPAPMGWVARLLRWLPDALFDRLMAGRGRKPRRATAR